MGNGVNVLCSINPNIRMGGLIWLDQASVYRAALSNDEIGTRWAESASRTPTVTTRRATSLTSSLRRLIPTVITLWVASTIMATPGESPVHGYGLYCEGERGHDESNSFMKKRIQRNDKRSYDCCLLCPCIGNGKHSLWAIPLRGHLLMGLCISMGSGQNPKNSPFESAG